LIARSAMRAGARLLTFSAIDAMQIAKQKRGRRDPEPVSHRAVGIFEKRTPFTLADVAAAEHGDPLLP
jgi:hypothetical protein